MEWEFLVLDADDMARNGRNFPGVLRSFCDRD